MGSGCCVRTELFLVSGCINQYHAEHFRQIVLLLNLESGGNSLELWRRFQQLKKKYEQVKEENNFLKLKYELLMEVVRT